MKAKFLKSGAILAVKALAYIAYLWFMPHRDIQTPKEFATIKATVLVNEFLSDSEKANNVYLDSEGESKVLIVEGLVADISKDQLGQKVVLLKDPSEKMGVSCTFTMDTNDQVESLEVGVTIKIKGVFRSGAEYDEDLDLTENVIIEKCAIVK